MENREINNIYAVPFIGGILCIITLFDPVTFLSISYNPIVGVIFLIPGLLNLICGIIMIFSAIKMRNGKTTLIEERKKIMISSWLAVSVSLGFAIFQLLIMGFFVIFFEYGLVGGSITIFGIYFYRHLSQVLRKNKYFMPIPNFAIIVDLILKKDPLNSVQIVATN
jgi:hypothetical protein